ncbi:MULTISPECIES: DUF4235 domain-containing protein [Streptomyces]|uniref:DUF4235 domain-containing protein n=1 Tax=Streptomyces TaxID=1883 RepID=UPI0006EB5213|nr:MULTISPECIES: DUF4235 domain-containing protein [Streptomyces]
MKAARIAYQPVGLTLGAVGGVLAGKLFQKVWKRLGHEDDVPNATDEHRGWSEVLAAAVLQGAIFAGVKAAVDRGGAVAARRLTGTWPG